MKKILLLLTIQLLATLFSSLVAQPYLDGNRRYSFAQTVIGLDLQYLPQNGKSAFINSSNNVQDYKFGNTLIPRLTISGLHFWGHAEFYIHIPLANFNLKSVEGVKATFSTSVETGMKFFPWRIEHHKLRPFVGFSLNTVYFTQSSDQNGDGTDWVKARIPLHAGFTFNHKNSLIELGMSFYHHRQSEYYIDRAISRQIESPSLTFNIGYKFYFDTTLGASTWTENGYFDKKINAMSEERLLDGLSVGLGYSSVFFVRESSYNNEIRPFLGNHKNGNTFFELGLGYYFFRPDIHLNISYRKMGASLGAYGLSQELSRNAITLEAYKFIGDYHGFVPFIGPAISFERLKAKETDQEQSIFDIKENKIAPGIIFGWDIRPTRLQSFVLRTNLRYFPALHLNPSDDLKISFDNIEFNFIQVVYYPGVTKRIKKFRF